MRGKRAGVAYPTAPAHQERKKLNFPELLYAKGEQFEESRES
jgi:hypothetical protein